MARMGTGVTWMHVWGAALRSGRVDAWRKTADRFNPVLMIVLSPVAMTRTLAATVAVALVCLVAPVPAAADGATSLQVAVRRTRDVRETEIYVRREHAARLGPFSLVTGASITDRRALWIGVGLSGSFGIGGGWTLDGAVMPGLRDDGTGPDLGHPVEIRSSAGLARRIGPGRVAFGIDHLSNANLGRVNPGSDAVFLRYRFGR